MYLCSTGYDPAREHGINPLDLALAIDWGVGAGEIRLSAKDEAAPSLADFGRDNNLPTWTGSA